VSLEFPSNTFDGYWSVQALQHIPDLHKALKEAKRVLKPTGVFVDYSLNDCLLARLVYRIMRKQYVVEGMVRDLFFLRRMTDKTFRIYSEVFSTPPKTRYSEIIFKPEFRFAGPGREDSFLGKIDCWLSGSIKMLLLVARQRSTHISM
jgi:ubiquinone/menaquinone biosynthesis C-methylase UbiE